MVSDQPQNNRLARIVRPDEEIHPPKWCDKLGFGPNPAIELCRYALKKN
jgi:hypothetical protein